MKQSNTWIRMAYLTVGTIIYTFCLFKQTQATAKSVTKSLPETISSIRLSNPNHVYLRNNNNKEGNLYLTTHRYTNQNSDACLNYSCVIPADALIQIPTFFSYDISPREIFTTRHLTTLSVKIKGSKTLKPFFTTVGKWPSFGPSYKDTFTYDDTWFKPTQTKYVLTLEWLIPSINP
jgi:hypothetical protein